MSPCSLFAALFYPLDLLNHNLTTTTHFFLPLRLQHLRLRRILLVEAALMLGAGCVTGALAGIYGQFIIDAYLRHVTGFPVASLAASPRPVEILALVIASVLAIVALPAWLASRVSPTLALNE